jgi:ribosomal protein S18 acetylase RimI-like enzyme
MTVTEAIQVELHSRRRVGAQELRGLYDSAGWWPERSDEELEPLLARGPAVGAWRGDQLVGFARAVSDGRFRAYVEDVVVLPEFRRRGVASQVLLLLLEQLMEIDVVSLFCSEEHVPVYRRSGFVPREDVVMHRYRSRG